MNWSRGFFRVWVVIACLWIGAASVISYSDWQRSLSREREIQRQPQPSPAAIKSAPPVQSMSEDGPWKDYPIVAPENRKPDPFERIAAEDRAAETAQWVAQWRWHLVETYLYAGLLPPLALLGAGLVIRWIARGFRGA